MIAADASVAIAWLAGAEFAEVATMDRLLRAGDLVLPPPVLAEVASGPHVDRASLDRITGLTLLPIRDGYWLRAGILRASVLRAGRRARLPDTLIAQCCIDADVPLLTRDADFVAFVEVGGLKLA